MTNSAAGSIYDELLCRIDNSTESRLFRKIVILVSLGMWKPVLTSIWEVQ